MTTSRSRTAWLGSTQPDGWRWPGGGRVIVLEVRPTEEYATDYLPGAVNLPLKDLEKHLPDLEPSHEIVAYCRGTHCVLAFVAVSKLREKGIKDRRLYGGLPEWRLEGLPVEASK